jgi:hypothetical protein
LEKPFPLYPPRQEHTQRYFGKGLLLRQRSTPFDRQIQTPVVHVEIKKAKNAQNKLK